MKPVDVLLFVEHVARELDVACLVKAFAQSEHGIDVEVLSLPFDGERALSEYRPTVVAVPYLYSTRSRRIPELLARWPRAVYFNLAWEQVLHGANRSFHRPRERFVKESVFHHAWTRPYREFLLAHGVRAEGIVPNNNPAVQLYRAPYRDCLPGRQVLARRHGLRSDVRWLFFPENYGWAFLSDREIEAKIRQGYDPQTARINRQFNCDSLAQTVRWLGRLAQERKIEILLRPRPAIAKDDYLRRVSEVIGTPPASLHVVKAGTVREWNLASDLVISSISTTLLEAAAAGKPTYLIEPIPFPEFLQSEWTRLGTRLTHYDELAAACDSPLPEASEKLRVYVEQLHCAPGDAIANLAAALSRLVRESRSSDGPLRPAAVVPWADRLRDLRRRWRRPTPRPRADARFSDDDFSAEEVQLRMAAFGPALGEMARVP